MRHNNLRDVNAEFQKEVCHDVKVEPMLIPIEGENTQIEGAKEDGAHPDISSRGLWSPFERTFYDVQVIHPNSPSYLDTTPKQLLVQKEKIKMRKYNVRALQVEKGTFTPYCIPHLEDGAHKLLHTTDDWQIRSQRRQKKSMRQ